MTRLIELVLKLRRLAESIPYSVCALLARAAIAGIFGGLRRADRDSDSAAEDRQ